MDDKLKRWHRAQIDAYRDEAPIYAVYAATLREILQKAANVVTPLGIVQVRPKALSSFAEKALRKLKDHDDPVHQLTDLCGGRVITVTFAEMEKMCAFIERHFTIDWDNSQDVRTRLRPSEFGYLSVHYIIQLKGDKVLGVPVPKEIGMRKAEVQIRTLLQHAWSEISHDRIYKNKIPVPAPLVRGTARMAALLEQAESTFSELVDDIDAYVVNYGAYMDNDRIRDEIDTLSTIFENEVNPSKKPGIALRIAKVAKAVQQWDTIIAWLQPYASLNQATILRELGYALCQANKDEPKGGLYRQGQRYLDKAIALQPDDAEAYQLLAETWQEITYAKEKARDAYRRAYELDPSSPYHLASFIEYELFCDGSGSILTALHPIIRAGIAKCRDHAEVRVELPWAYFTMGKLHLYLGEAYPSLYAYCKGAQLCADPSTGYPEGVLDDQLESLRRIESVQSALPGSDWERTLLLSGIHRLLLLAKAVGFHKGMPCDELRALARAKYDTRQDVLVVAGGCGAEVEDAMRAYQGYVREALEAFQGVVVCGGTTAGISGVVGRVVRALKRGGALGFEAVGYHPRSMPADVRPDARNYTLHASDGQDFSALDPLQMWTDLLASGVDPSHVKVLGINGGPIAGFEYRLAAALGATVGIVEETGRAASEFLNERDWVELANVHPLPNDQMTVRAFVNPGRTALRSADLERAGRAVHTKYCESNRHKVDEPAAMTWKELPEHLRTSNREQAAYAENILRKVGFGVRNASGKKVKRPKFTKKEIELMAEMEHGRWTVERLGNGWKLGPERDAKEKISPYLVSWRKLPEAIKDYDRAAVQEFPEVLAKAGLEVYRLTPRKR